MAHRVDYGDFKIVPYFRIARNGSHFRSLGAQLWGGWGDSRIYIGLSLYLLFFDIEMSITRERELLFSKVEE